MGRYINQPAQMKVRSMISRTPEDRRVPLSKRLERFYDNWVNDLAPIERSMKRLEEFGLDPKQAQMVNDYAVNYIGGWRGKAEHTLRVKQIDLNGNDLGPSLREILKGVESLDDLGDYLVSKRALEKNAQGKTTGIDSRDAREVVNAHGARYEPVARQLLDFQRNQRNLLLEAGIISKDQVKAMDALNEDYVPFHRVMENLGGGGGVKKGEGFINTGQGVSRFKGSDRQIVDPLESIVKNTYLFRDLAERNRVGRLFVDAAEATRGGGRVAEGIARKIKPAEVTDAEVRAWLTQMGLLPNRSGLITSALQPMVDAALGGRDLSFKIWRAAQNRSAKDGVFTVWKDGQETPYQVGDPELYRALSLADATDARFFNAIPGLSIARAFTHTLRAGSTLTPEFIARNPFRDQITAGVNSKHGFIPFWDGFRGVFHALGQDKWFQEWQKSGGRYSDFVGLDRTDLQKTLADVVKEPGAKAMALQLANPLNVLQNLRKFSEVMEMATRISEYRNARQSGATEVQAANASKDVTLNFARAGFKGKFLNQMVAFFNASVQDFDKTVRAHREQPLRTTAKALAYITAPSLLAWYLGQDDKAIQDLPDWRKNFFWNVNLRGLPGVEDDFVMSFPKPFLLGQLYGSSVERGLDYAKGKDPNAVRKWFDGLVQSTPFNAQTFLGPLTGGTAGKPVVEAVANHSFFRGEPLENQSMSALPAEFRFGPGTSELAKQMSHVMPWDISPIKIDNTLRGYLGGMARYGTDAADWLMVKTALADVPPPVEKTIWERPLFRGFVRSPYEASAWVERFYNGLEAAEQRLTTLRKAPELMEKAETQKWARQNVPDLAHYLMTVKGQPQISQVRQVREELSAVHKAMTEVQNSRELNPAEKRERLLKLSKMRDGLAEFGFKLLSPQDQREKF